MAADVASVQFSRTVERRITPADVGFMRARSLRVCPTTGGRRSLKTQQHAGVVIGVCAVFPSSQGSRALAPIQPGSVDMLGPSVLSPTGSQDSQVSQGPGGRYARGTVMCSLERR